MFDIGKVTWWQRIGAALFGKKSITEDNGTRLYFSYWRGAYYLLAKKENKKHGDISNDRRNVL